MEVSKTTITKDEYDGVPFVEELTEDEYAQEMKSQEDPAIPELDLTPEQEDEMVKTLSKQNARKKIQMELDGHDNAGKEGYVNGKYHYSYSEYKTGLKSLSDLIVSSDAKDDPALQAQYRLRRRKFCVNAAAACIKIHHFAQGLEACSLVLEEGPDDDAQRRKALYRAGVCARGMGELDAATQFFHKLLSEEDGIDESSVRDVKKQLKGIAQEKKRYKKFAREMCSSKNAESIILPTKSSDGPPKTQEELDKLAEVEEKREAYLQSQKDRKAIDEKERRKKNGEEGEEEMVRVRPPEVMITEEECMELLDELMERYKRKEVQEALKEASLDHELTFTKGYIIRSKKILAPLQQDLLEKYGFLEKNSVSEDANSADDKEENVHNDAVKDSGTGGSFDNTLDDLVLIGTGAREMPSEEPGNLYKVGVYASEETKEKIISDMAVPSAGDSSENLSVISAALKSTTKTTFLLQLDAQMNASDMSAEFLSLVYPSKPDNAALAHLSSFIYRAGETMQKENVFPTGTTFRLDCSCLGNDNEVNISVGGKEIGSIRGLGEAFCDGLLNQETVGPSLCKSVNGHGGNADANVSEVDTSAQEDATPKKDIVAEEKSIANTKAHDESLKKMQHTVRYLASKNKEITKKMELCQKLAIGDVIMLTDD
mmetsp:Transcript_1547/g.3004  ORF Transcript_1547/g.3004 Transcript_1547/m.3004 type:complete len:656 (+) Transcript_1547:65-2032(+)